MLIRCLYIFQSSGSLTCQKSGLSWQGGVIDCISGKNLESNLEFPAEKSNQLIAFILKLFRVRERSFRQQCEEKTRLQLQCGRKVFIV